jgi:hypothetical protein
MLDAGVMMVSNERAQPVDEVDARYDSVTDLGTPAWWRDLQEAQRAVTNLAVENNRVTGPELNSVPQFLAEQLDLSADVSSGCGGLQRTERALRPVPTGAKSYRGLACDKALLASSNSAPKI